MNKEFIQYEEATILKAFGFNEPCSAFYKERDSEMYYDTIIQSKKVIFRNNKDLNTFSDIKKRFSAPTYHQAFRWVREKYGISCYIFECRHHNGEVMDYHPVITIKGANEPLSDTLLDEWRTYEDAELSCLKNLIKQIDLILFKEYKNKKH